MKKFIVLFSVLFLLSNAFGQRDSSSVYKNLKTKKFYRVNTSSQTTDSHTTYTVNGNEVCREYYQKYHSTWDNMANCCPCILQSYDENDVLLTEAVSCTDCLVGWYKEYYPSGQLKVIGHYKENPTGRWRNIWDRGECNVMMGEWIY